MASCTNMFRALIGFVAVMVIVCAIATLLPREFIWGYAAGSGSLMAWMTIAALPALIVWGVLEVMQFVRPRRIFLGKRRTTGALLAWGGAVAVLTTIIAALAMAWLDRTLSDGLIFSASAALATLLLIPLPPRHRKGCCVYCSYDLRGATVHSANCCAECGKPQPV